MPSLAVAPMLDCTDRHARFLYRLLSRQTVLYTEMVVAQALRHRHPARWLDYHPIEHPVILQLAGDDPTCLGQAARLAAEWGYDGINLNVGCPSNKVTAGHFGACLFLEPERVGDCVAAMRAASNLPVSVKTCLGVDERDHYEDLSHFVTQVSRAGCHAFIIHARKAWLSGLSAAQNRCVPPLCYNQVYRLKQDFSALDISINGGIATLEMAWDLCQQGNLDGAMLGRALYANPTLLAAADRIFYGSIQPDPELPAVLQDYCHYLEDKALAPGSPRTAARHLQGLFRGQAGARQWRTALAQVRTASDLRQAVTAQERLGSRPDDPDNVPHPEPPYNHCPPK